MEKAEKIQPPLPDDMKAKRDEDNKEKECRGQRERAR